MKIKYGIVAICIALIMQGVFYPATFTVSNVDYYHDVVTVETSTGIQYQFYGAEDYITGDLVSAIMFNHGTDTVYDDEIITTRYAGYNYLIDSAYISSAIFYTFVNGTDYPGIIDSDGNIYITDFGGALPEDGAEIKVWYDTNGTETRADDVPITWNYID